MARIDKHFKVIYENRMTGGQTVELSPPLGEAVREYLYETTGELFEDVARRGRVNKRGRMTYHCGVGYATFDSDCLGGTGDGLKERDFRDWCDSKGYMQ